MNELYADISKDVKEIGELAWQVALAQDSPAQAATFLDSVINYYRYFYTTDEIEFLQFYFKMKMMEMKKE